MGNHCDDDDDDDDDHNINLCQKTLRQFEPTALRDPSQHFDLEEAGRHQLVSVM